MGRNEREDIYREMFENVRELAIVILAPDGTIREWNRGAEDLLGYTEEEAVGSPSAIFFPPEAVAAGQPASELETAAAEGRAEDETWHVRKDGSRFWGSGVVVPVSGGSGGMRGFAKIFRDQTRRFEIEDALRESEARFRTMADTAPVLIWMAGSDRECIFLNRPWLEFRGRSLEDELGSGWLEGVHPDDRDACLETFRKAFDARESFRMEYRLRRHDGEYRWMLETGVPRLTPTGRFEGFIGSCIDIHEGVLQRRALEQAERRSRLLADASRVLASSLDYETTLRTVARIAVPAFADLSVVHVAQEDGRIVQVELAHADPEQEPIHRELQASFLSEPEHPEGPLGRVLRTRKPLVVEEVTEELLEGLAPDRPRTKRTAPAPIRSLVMLPLLARGEVLGAISFAITGEERRFGPEDVALAEELARRAAVAVDNALLYRTALAADRTKSHFLAVMSHELRTPLNAMTGLTSLLQSGIPEPLPEEAEAQVRRIRSAVEHLLTLIDEVLVFSRLEANGEEVRVEEADLGDLVRDLGSLTEALAQEKGLGFAIHAPEEPLPVQTDSRKLRQILLNLLSNAIKFTDSGEVSVAVSVEEGVITAAVRDTGVGIPADQHEAIFDPFRQVEQGPTRPAGGTGLGLNVARRLARLLGGDVTVESAPGRGSTFTLTVPAAAPSSGRPGDQKR